MPEFQQSVIFIEHLITVNLKEKLTSIELTSSEQTNIKNGLNKINVNSILNETNNCETSTFNNKQR